MTDLTEPGEEPAGLPKPRTAETPEARVKRLLGKSDAKRTHDAEEDAAVDRMIRRNIEQHGA